MFPQLQVAWTIVDKIIDAGPQSARATGGDVAFMAIVRVSTISGPFVPRMRCRARVTDREGTLE